MHDRREAARFFWQSRWVERFWANVVRASLAILVLAAALLGMVLLLLPATQRRPAPAAPPQDEVPKDLQGGATARPAEPDQHLEPAPLQPGHPERPADAPEPAPSVDVPPHPSSPEYAARLATRFDADPPDVNRELEREIAARATALMPAGSRLDTIECRQMLCRVRSLHPDRPTYDAFMASAFRDDEPDKRLWTGQAWVAAPAESANERTGARIVSLIYLQRDPNPAPPPR